MQNGVSCVVGNLGNLLGDHAGFRRRGVLDKEHGSGAQCPLGNAFGLRDVLQEFYHCSFLRGVILLCSSQEALNRCYKATFAFSAFIGGVGSNFTHIGKENTVHGIVFFVEVGNPPRAVQVDSGVAGDKVAVDIGCTGRNCSVKGVVVHLFEHLCCLHKCGIGKTVSIYVLAADGLYQQGVPQHRTPAVFTGHLPHDIVAGCFHVCCHLEKFIIGCREMIPARCSKNFGVVDRGKYSSFERQDRDLSVYTPCVECTVGKVLAPAIFQIRGQVHKFAGLGKGLDIKGGVKNAEVRGVAGCDGGADLVAVGLVIGLLFHFHTDGACIFCIEGLNHFGKIGCLGVGSYPDAGEVDDDLTVGRSGNGKSRQRKAHGDSQKHCEEFFHVSPPF